MEKIEVLFLIFSIIGLLGYCFLDSSQEFLIGASVGLGLTSDVSCIIMYYKRKKNEAIEK